MLYSAMTTIPARVRTRLSRGLRKYQPILEQAKRQDVNEAVTVDRIKDLLTDVFGYEKFTEITAEFMTSGMFCDIGIKLGGELKLLIEAKAIGTKLTVAHERQAVTYASHKGLGWGVLTTGAVWRIYEIRYGRPNTHEMIAEFDLLSLNSKSPADVESLFPLTREGLQKGALKTLGFWRHATNPYNLAAIVLSDDVVAVIRKLLRKQSPLLKIDKNEIGSLLRQEVLKREVTEGEEAREAQKRIAKMFKEKRKAIGGGTTPEKNAE